MRNFVIFLFAIAFSIKSLAQISCTTSISDNNVCIGDSVTLTATAFTPKASLLLDGANDYVLIPSNAQLNFGSSVDFTIEAWLKTGFVSGSQKWLVAKSGYTTNPTYNLGILNGKGVVAFGSGSVLQQNYGNVFISDNQWHHIAVSFNRSTGECKLYIDGILDSNASISQVGNVNNNQPLSIGSANAPQANHAFFPGSVDEVRIWNRILTANEIQSKKLKELNPALEVGLIGYWPMNTGSGLTLLDHSGNNHNGTLQNGVIWQTDSPPFVKPPLTFLWSTGQTGSSVVVSPIATTNYSVLVSNGLLNCSSNVSVNVNQTDTTSIIGPSEIYIGDTAVFTLTNALAGQWTISDGSQASGNTTNHIFQSTGIYIVTFTSSGNCKSTFSHTILVSEPPEVFNTFIPNVFTPNGDNFNDKYKPTVPSTKEFSMKIFNRWGNLVFETMDPEDGWTGAGFAAGIYYLLVDATLSNGSPLMVKQTITLITDNK